MLLSIDSTIDKVVGQHFDQLKRQVPFAASRAINQTAFFIAKEELPKQTERVFMGGSERWTKQGFAYTPSTKKNLTATVYVRENQSYLNTQIFGGTTRPKAGKALIERTKHSRITTRGNVSKRMRGSYIKRGGTKGTKLFIGKAGKSGNYGVWERMKHNKLRLLLNMTQDPWKYEKRFEFHWFAKVAFEKRFEAAFRVSLEKAMG